MYMKTIGFPISTKENEKRRCMIPKHRRRFCNSSW